jgi:hypothetical protein
LNFELGLQIKSKLFFKISGAVADIGVEEDEEDEVKY